MNPRDPTPPLTRRDALRRIGGGFGMLAFAACRPLARAREALASRRRRVTAHARSPARAKR
jgi:hypothetical protein